MLIHRFPIGQDFYEFPVEIETQVKVIMLKFHIIKTVKFSE